MKHFWNNKELEMMQQGWAILNSRKCNNNICGIRAEADGEQKSWERAVISCDQTADSKVMVTNRSQPAPSATASFKYKRLAGAGGEAQIMSFVMDYYYLERLLPLFYLSWLARIDKQTYSAPPTLLLNWLKLWKDEDACRRSAEVFCGHRRRDSTEVTRRWSVVCPQARLRFGRQTALDWLQLCKREEQKEGSSWLVDHLVLREPVWVQWRAELCPRTHLCLGWQGRNVELKSWTHTAPMKPTAIWQKKSENNLPRLVFKSMQHSVYSASKLRKRK